MCAESGSPGLANVDSARVFEVEPVLSCRDSALCTVNVKLMASRRCVAHECIDRRGLQEAKVELSCMRCCPCLLHHGLRVEGSGDLGGALIYRAVPDRQEAAGGYRRLHLATTER